MFACDDIEGRLRYEEYCNTRTVGIGDSATCSTTIIAIASCLAVAMAWMSGHSSHVVGEVGNGQDGAGADSDYSHLCLPFWRVERCSRRQFDRVQG